MARFQPIVVQGLCPWWVLRAKPSRGLGQRPSAFLPSPECPCAGLYREVEGQIGDIFQPLALDHDREDVLGLGITKIFD